MLLKQFRLNKNLTQSEIAEKLQISVRQYQRIESGKSFPNESALGKLEDLFKVPHRVLLAKSKDEIPDYLKNFLP